MPRRKAWTQKSAKVSPRKTIGMRDLIDRKGLTYVIGGENFGRDEGDGGVLARGVHLGEDFLREGLLDSERNLVSMASPGKRKLGEKGTTNW